MRLGPNGLELSDEEMAELRSAFLAQAVENLEDIDRHALRLEQDRAADALGEIRRAVHTLKGDSGAAGYRRVSTLAHRLEDALDQTRESGGPSAALTTLLLEWTAAVRAIIEGAEPPAGEVERALETALARLTAARSDGAFVATITFDPRCALRAAGADLVLRRLAPHARVAAAEPPLDRLDTEQPARLVLSLEGVADADAARRALQVGGVIAEATLEPRPTDRPPAGAPPAPAASEPSPDEAPMPGGPKQADTVRVTASRIDHAMTLVGELAIARGEIGVAVDALAARLARDVGLEQLGGALAHLDRSLRELQKTVLGTRLVPVDQLFRRLPRLVREVARSLGREARLVTRGGDTELDKRLVDALADPLLHLVRNSIDHGIEPPVAREAAGKPREGRVVVSARHVGNQVILEIEDDGRGIDRTALVRRAVERGVVSQEKAAGLSDADQLALVFAAGLSTATSVTEVSGRGIGMDVVKQAVERLRGRVHVETTPGAGTRIALRLPLTLAIQKALLVRVGTERYALPLASVLELVRPSARGFETVEGHEVLTLRDQVLPVQRLAHVVPGGCRDGGPVRPVVAVVSDGERRFGLVVDELAGEQELVIKALDDRWAATPLASGAAVLGDGRAVLILDVAALAGRLSRAVAGVAWS
jgi:two-component system chemotaxis sensor kinase CheA